RSLRRAVRLRCAKIDTPSERPVSNRCMSNVRNHCHKFDSPSRTPLKFSVKMVLDEAEIHAVSMACMYHCGNPQWYGKPLKQRGLLSRQGGHSSRYWCQQDRVFARRMKRRFFLLTFSTMYPLPVGTHSGTASHCNSVDFRLVRRTFVEFLVPAAPLPDTGWRYGGVSVPTDSGGIPLTILRSALG